MFPCPVIPPRGLFGPAVARVHQAQVFLVLQGRGAGDGLEVFDWLSISLPKVDVTRGAEGDFLSLCHRDIFGRASREPLSTSKPVTENPARLLL